VSHVILINFFQCLIPLAVHTGVCNPVEHIRALIRGYHYSNVEMA